MVWLTALIALFLASPALRAQEDAAHPINLDLVDGDLGKAIWMLMQASRANIVLPGDLAGKKVNCRLVDMTLEDILDALLLPTGLYWQKTERGVYIITKDAPAKPAPVAATPPPVVDSGPPPTPVATNSGVLDLTQPLPASIGPLMRPRLKVDKIDLRIMDARTACYIIGRGVDPGIELLAAKFREVGAPTGGLPTLFPNRAAHVGPFAGNSGGGGDDLWRRLEQGFQGPNAFPGPALMGNGGFNQFPGGGGFSGGGGGVPGGGAPGGGAPGVPGGGGPGAGGAAGGGQSLLPEGIMSIMPYELDNSLIVRGTEEAIQELRDLIKMLDRPPKQVRIEAEFLTVDVGDEERFGFNWQISDGQTSISANLASGGDLNVRYQLGNFGVAIQALKNDHRGRTIIAPRITTMNNVPASIAQSVVTYITVVSAVPTGAFGGVEVTRQPYPVPVQISLSVVPRINGDDSVTMQLAPQVSDITGTQEGPNGESLPIIQTQQIQIPAIRVKNHETLVLGGLVRRNESRAYTKLPFFSEIPLIGNLFQRRSKNQNDSELLIFITPHVLPPDEGVEALTPVIGAVAPAPGPPN